MNKKSTHNSMRNITRHSQSNAWQVRVTRGGVQRSKLFTDNKMIFVSPAMSLALAVEYRNLLTNVSFPEFINFD